MKALPTLFAIASTVRQATLTNAILRTAHQYRHLSITDRTECCDLIRKCVDDRLHHPTTIVAFVAAVLDTECWITHRASIVELHEPQTLIAAINNVLTQHGFIQPTASV
jgi:hypothetical protein